ncbi:hypothetical protein, partial [Micromonospora aurantiaca (nom. illeg.)]
MSLVGTAFLLAGVAGALPGPAAAALAVAGGFALACVRLAWLAGAATPPDRPAPTGHPAPPDRPAP